VVSINVDTGRTERGNCHWGNKYFGRSRCVQIRGKLFKIGSYSPSATDKKRTPYGVELEKLYMAPFVVSLYVPGIVSGTLRACYKRWCLKYVLKFLRLWKKSHRVIHINLNILLIILQIHEVNMAVD